MIIDSHAHVVLPPHTMLESMDDAGIDCTILFQTSVHPERADNLESLDREMQKLNQILAGKNASTDIHLRALEEQASCIRAHPDRFIGFGRVPLNMTRDDTAQWIEQRVIGLNFRGLGEFTVSPGNVSDLTVIFEASAETCNLPLWIHTFHPLRLKDLAEIEALSRRYSKVPVIMGHMGGTNWMQVIRWATNNPRLYLDLSACFTVLAPAMAIRELPERTLFSSDAPYGDPFLVKTMVEKITSDRGIRKRVLGDNTTELLGL